MRLCTLLNPLLIIAIRENSIGLISSQRVQIRGIKYLTLYMHAVTTLSLDSVTTSASRIVPSVAAVLGGGIGGALLLLATILLLTTCFVIACYCHQTRESKTENHSDHQLQGRLSNEGDKKPNSDHEFELKDNKAYSSISHYIPTDDNVAYGQTAQQILTVAYYGQYKYN